MNARFPNYTLPFIVLAMIACAGCLPTVSWLPDSGGIIYTTTDWPGLDNDSAIIARRGGRWMPKELQGRLIHYDLKTKLTRIIAKAETSTIQPALSPNGRQIAVARLKLEKGNQTTLQVVVYDLAGKEIQRSKLFEWGGVPKYDTEVGGIQKYSQLFWAPRENKVLLSPTTAAASTTWGSTTRDAGPCPPLDLRNDAGSAGWQRLPPCQGRSRVPGAGSSFGGPCICGLGGQGVGHRHARRKTKRPRTRYPVRAGLVLVALGRECGHRHLEEPGMADRHRQENRRLAKRRRSRVGFRRKGNPADLHIFQWQDETRRHLPGKPAVFQKDAVRVDLIGPEADRRRTLIEMTPYCGVYPSPNNELVALRYMAKGKTQEDCPRDMILVVNAKGETVADFEAGK